MITLKVTITGKTACAEREMRGRVRNELLTLHQNGGSTDVVMEPLEETVPLTLELAAQRVVVADAGERSAPIDDLRRVLAGEYVCVPQEPAP